MLLNKSATRFQVKELDAGSRTFSGLSSTWDEDLGGDIIHRGAFKRTLDSWRSSGRVIPLIDQHNYGSVRSVVGKMVEATESTKGLESSFEVIEGPDGDEVLRRLEGGFVDGLSIGYEAVKWEWERPEGADPWEAVRHLKELKLYEVSVVIWGMNPDALIDPSSFKSLFNAARSGRLTDEQKDQLRALFPGSDSSKGSPPSDELEEPAGTPTGDGLAQFEAADMLRAKLHRLKLSRIGVHAGR